MEHDTVACGWPTIPDLFAAQAANRPDAIAAWYKGERLTYGELDAASDGIATWLSRHRIGLEDVVGLRVPRSLEQIIALVGIVKAGGVYLPLEDNMPMARQEHVMRQANAAALISMDDMELDWAAEVRPVLRLSAGLPTGAAICSPALPESLAYLSFTSGSTGRPKPVGVPHRAVARLVAGGFADLGPDETMLAMSSLAFDASTLEIWGCLLNGGRLVILSPGTLDSAELSETLEAGGVTIAWMTAGLFHRMVEHNLAALGGLRQLIAGGDVLHPELVNRFRERFPNTRLINGYGPTENTTFTTCHTIAETAAGSVPIGRAIPGTEIRVLDERLYAAATGERGELYAAGAGLSRGYIGMPAMTAVRFVPDPASGQPGGRMYRTGDLVRVLPTGDLDFCGRADRQLKVRGYRVEPEEIERAILRAAGVSQAAVIARTNQLGEKDLVAFVSPLPGDDQSALVLARVRRYLREHLPGPMMPAAFVRVDSLPLNSSNKVDTSALQIPARAPRSADTDYVAPRSATEHIVAGLWADTLAVDHVGAYDDFFELGGNSLLAMDLIGAAELVFNVDLPARALLYHPHVDEFARSIDELTAVPGGGQ